MFEGVLVEDEKVRERGKNKVNNEAKDPTKCQLVSRCFSTSRIQASAQSNQNKIELKEERKKKGDKQRELTK